MNGERSVKSELAILTAPEICFKIPFCPLTPVFLICFLPSILSHSLGFYFAVFIAVFYCLRFIVMQHFEKIKWNSYLQKVRFLVTKIMAATINFTAPGAKTTEGRLRFLLYLVFALSEHSGPWTKTGGGGARIRGRGYGSGLGSRRRRCFENCPWFWTNVNISVISMP